MMATSISTRSRRIATAICIAAMMMFTSVYGTAVLDTVTGMEFGVSAYASGGGNAH